jgi:hypothetical protein
MIFLLFIIPVFIFCSPKSDRVEKFMEEGVEVVMNHLEPYQINGEPCKLALEKEFSIDFEREDIGELGIADATAFEVDAKGNIYFFYSNKKGNLIFKFDENGKFMHTFGHQGQGPGEIQFILYTGMDSQNNLTVYDHTNKKILVFDQQGQLLKENRTPTDGRSAYPLGNGNYICLGDRFSENKQRLDWVLSVSDPDYKTVKELITQNQDPYNMDANGYRAVNSVPFIKWRIYADHIYAACEDRGYDIFKFDFNGSLVQIIRKEYEPEVIPSDVIEERKKIFERYGDKFFFPKYWLPICDFFLDEAGRIYVMTFKRGDRPGEYFYDLFNPDGVFISQKSLNIFVEGDRTVCAQAKGESLYCFQEKPDGYREFVAYRMRWE